MIKRTIYKLSSFIVFIFVLAIFPVATAASAFAGSASIEARIFKNDAGSTMPYRILIPENYRPDEKYPLVLSLHGAGGRGTDNKSRGTHAFEVLSSPEVQKKYPAFLLTPQCPKRKKWVNTRWKTSSYSISIVPISEELKLALEILESVQKEFSIDANRIYVTGKSMGAYGTWDLILRYPNKFAAAVPVSGIGDPGSAQKIVNVPIWAFHGEQDTVVPTEGSRKMVTALIRAGSKVKYTEYPGVAHTAWKYAWKEKDLIPWLFKQRLSPALIIDK